MSEEFEPRQAFSEELPFHSPVIDGYRKALTGLAVVAVVNVDTGHPLMVGYANDQALALTLEQQRVVLWSTSRNELWIKGKTSGNSLEIYDVTQDPLGRFILYWVDKVEHPACHLEARSCFFHDMVQRTLIEAPPKLMAGHLDRLEVMNAKVESRLLNL